jgi:hypothetical protein
MNDPGSPFALPQNHYSLFIIHSNPLLHMRTFLYFPATLVALSAAEQVQTHGGGRAPDVDLLDGTQHIFDPSGPDYPVPGQGPIIYLPR